MKSSPPPRPAPAAGPAKAAAAAPPAAKPVWARPAVLVAGAALVLGGIMFLVLWSDMPPEQTFKLVKEFPHSTESYCQGLLWHDGILYESGGKNNQSALYRTKLESLGTGEMLPRVGVSSDYFAEGIAVWKDKLIQLTWRNKTALVYQLPDLKKTGTFKYDGEGWGLTSDGTHLIRSDGSDKLFFHDPGTFAVVRSVEVRAGRKAVPMLNELEYIEGEVWANIFQTDRIARIDPATGKVNSFVDLTGIIDTTGLKAGDEVLNGIAWIPETKRLFVTGKNWPKLFEILVVPRG